MFNRSRFDTIYQQVLTPKFTWIYLDPMALIVAFITFLVGYLTLVMGVSGTANLIHHFPQMDAAVIALVGSAEIFARMVIVGWCFMFFAHLVEAVFVYLNAKRQLKLKESSILEWVMFTIFSGLPVVNRFLKYLELQKAGKSKLN